MFYETPQFVKQEVKLMGIITFNQLWLLVGILGFLAVLYFALNLWLWTILALIFGPLALFLTFGQMNGLPMYKVVPAAILHFWLPKYYFWKKEQIITEPKEATQQQTKTTIKPQIQKQLDKQTLENLSQFLDQ
ncbi:hypothetical protein GW888_01750 [Candidatus Wolfebacteria bacterium]|nr:hypothetical protein [Candidatus Wolfebacteria bacterium]